MNRCGERGEPVDRKKLFLGLDRKKDKLSEYRPLTQGEVDRLGEEFAIEYTYNSNAIEGNTLTLDETALVLREGVTIGGKSLREHLEVIGHRDAWLLAQEIVNENTPLTEQTMKQLHSLVLMHRKEDAGVYRCVPVEISGTAVKLQQPWQISAEMEWLLADYAGEMRLLHPIERVALFHLRFESIHPFIDGNRRTGRLLLNLELMKEGYPPIDIKFQDRMVYYSTFHTWDSNTNCNPMTELICRYLDSRLNENLRILQISNESHQQEQKMNQG